MVGDPSLLMQLRRSPPLPPEMSEWLGERLRKTPAPQGFVGELHDYQARGIAWMRFLSELDTGGILADDMGLGKTVQVLAHLLDERARGALGSQQWFGQRFRTPIEKEGTWRSVSGSRGASHR